MIRHLLAAIAVLALLSNPGLAQLTQPDASPPAQSSPANKKATKQSTVTTKVNLNTATAQELDGLPQIGPARIKAIIEARTKEPFKNWDDFVARKVVPANAQRAIKDLVAF